MVRSGRSLVELTVAVVVMALGLAAASAATVSAIRWTDTAAVRQDMLLVGQALLDSISSATDPEPGTAMLGSLRAEWLVDSLGAQHSLITIAINGPGHSPLRLRTLALHPLPVLPADSGSFVDDGEADEGP